MPCPQGAGGLARHSPALPLREMSILCLLKFWKAVDMTFTPSYVRAPVYCEEREKTIQTEANTVIRIDKGLGWGETMKIFLRISKVNYTLIFEESFSSAFISEDIISFTYISSSWPCKNTLMFGFRINPQSQLVGQLLWLKINNHLIAEIPHMNHQSQIGSGVIRPTDLIETL